MATGKIKLRRRTRGERSLITLTGASGAQSSGAVPIAGALVRRGLLGEAADAAVLVGRAGLDDGDDHRENGGRRVFGDAPMPRISSSAMSHAIVLELLTPVSAPFSYLPPMAKNTAEPHK
jgi:hypothetical protein